MGGNFDYSGYDAKAPDSVLRQISDYVGKWRELCATRDRLEAQLDDVNVQVKQIVEWDIPNLLDTNGLQSVQTLDGLNVKVKEDIRASITRERRPEAHAWLEENGHGDVIKTKVVTEFGRGEIDVARSLADKIEELTSKPAFVDEGVHANTLSALVRELLREGHEVPTELLGVVRLRKADISL